MAKPTGFKKRISMIAPFGPQTGGMVELARVLFSMFESAGYRMRKVNKSRSGFAPLSIVKMFFGVAGAAFFSDCLVVISASGRSLWMVDLPAVVAGRLAGKKTVVDFVGGMAMEEARNWPFMKRLAFRLAHVVVVPTNKMLESLRSQGIRANYEVIPHAADVELFAGCSIRPHENKRIILSAKNFEGYANVDHLIRCVAELCREFPGIELWIAGGGPEEVRLKKLAAELLQDKCVFLGKVDHDGMAEVMAKAEVLAHATKYESFGIVLVEAMAAGKPIVAYDAGGIADVVKDGKTGFLVEYGNINGLTEKISLLLRDRALAAGMGRTGLEESGKYTKEAILGEWERMLERLWL